MTFWEEVTERLGGSAGVGIGIAAAVLAPALVPALGRGLRSALKGGIKGYLLLSQRARGAMTEAGERLQDVYTEAKSEIEATGAAPSAGEQARATG